MVTKFKLSQAIGQRRSIRRYLPGSIDGLAIERLLGAAMQAPSAHNRQPWRFAVLDDRTSKVKLATAMGQRLRKDRTADGNDPQAIEDDVGRSYARIAEAPVVIVVCVDIRDMDRYPDEQRNTAEYLMAVQSTAMAVQNLLLAAHGEGLGACVMCAPLFCPDSVSDGLDLPSEWKAQMLVTIGAPANAGRICPRLPLAAVVRWTRRTDGPSSAR